MATHLKLKWSRYWCEGRGQFAAQAPVDSVKNKPLRHDMQNVALVMHFSQLTDWSHR